MAGEIEESFAFQDGFVPSDSISFGRFEVESLSWERRSSFSHNRYLEEVEQYAKTGPVSKKKAYFEAHFKRKSLMREASADCQEMTDIQLNDSNLDSVDYTGVLKDLDDAHHTPFDNMPDGSDEDKLKVDLDIHYFEVAHENDDEVVPKSSSTLSTGFDSMLEEEVQSTPAPVEIHYIQNESDVHFSARDDRTQEGELSNSVKQDDITQLIKTSNPSKDPENREALNTSSRETMAPPSKIGSSTGQKVGHSKTKERLTANPNLSRNRSVNTNRKPSIEATPRKTATKVQKTSLEENVIRKKTELPSIGKTSRIESVRVTAVTDSGKKMHIGASDSERAVPKEKTAPLNILSKDRTYVAKNVKSAMKELTKGKASQDNRRYSEDRVANHTKFQGVHESRHLKDVLDAHMSTERPKLDPRGNAIFNFKSDVRAEKRKEYYMKLEEKLHAKEVEMNQIQAKNQKYREAQVKQFRRSLNFKATPMPAFYLGAAPRSTDAKKAPLTRSKSPSLKKQPTSSYMVSASRENSTQQSASLISDGSITKPLDEKEDDRCCSDTAGTKIRNKLEVKIQSSSACLKTEIGHKDRTKGSSQRQQYLQVQSSVSKGEKIKLRALKSGAHGVKRGVSKRPGMVPLVADVTVVS